MYLNLLIFQYFAVPNRYLQEFTPLGTGGGLYHFRDQVRAGNPSAFFLLNGDVCADFPLKELWSFHEGANALVRFMYTNSYRHKMNLTQLFST